MNGMRVFLIGLAAALPLAATAAEPKSDLEELQELDDKIKVDADFPYQGEYDCKLKQGDETLAVGLQVIALGDGKFQAKAYRGGLPGAGWTGVKDKILVFEGPREGETLTLTDTSNDDRRIGIKDGGATLMDGDDKVGDGERVVRKSPTLGAKPPKGAVVLFDGTSADKFAGGRMTEGGLLKEGVTSKQKFGDQRVHLEFLLPYEPKDRGQGRGNSGCYLQGRYEVQILDSFGLEGKDNECGGIYGIKPPDVNMCYPPLTWQTYDIDFTAARYDDSGKKVAAARLTVRHNGVLIHDNVEVPQPTRAAPVKESPEPGPLYLQNHGDPLRFRNIWVVPKVEKSEPSE